MALFDWRSSSERSSLPSWFTSCENLRSRCCAEAAVPTWRVGRAVWLQLPTFNPLLEWRVASI